MVTHRCKKFWYDSHDDIDSNQASEGYKLKAECLFLFCLELLFSLCCNFWHIFKSSDKVAWYLKDLWLEQKQKERERERQQKKNRIPVIAQTWWKMLLHKVFLWALNRLLFLWMHILKKWFNGFFPLFRNEPRIVIVNWNEITIICTLLDIR